MSLTIGIPRALMYYRFMPLWLSFFQELGVEVIVSPQTNKRLLENGLSRALDDVCLPVKVAFGHVLHLCGQCDFLFLPRLICIEKDAYLCPKFTGFTDMVRASMPELPKLLDPIVNEKRSRRTMIHGLAKAGRRLGFKSRRVENALDHGLKMMDIFERGLMETLDPIQYIVDYEAFLKNGSGTPPHPGSQSSEGPVVAVLGHAYTLYDKYISMGLLSKLAESGVRSLRPDSIDRHAMEAFLSALDQRPFWTSGKEAVGSSLFFLDKKGIDGFIYVISFECGPDSMCREVVDYQAGLYRVPMLSLVLDEHTAEAGLVTRLQAFLDMLQR